MGSANLEEDRRIDVQAESECPIVGSTLGASVKERTESGPPKSPLKYKLQINKPGKYTLAIRARKRLETGRADISTDCFVALKGDQVSILVNGKRYDIPVASLSQADQEFIHDWQP